MPLSRARASGILVAMRDLLLATNNEHKKREFRRIFEGFSIQAPGDLGIEFFHEETATTFLGNALGKAVALWQALSPQQRETLTVVADDSGICVDALGGDPGVFSARFGSESFNDSERNAHLLSVLSGVSLRAAHYVCCMVALEAPDRYGAAQETWNGVIADAPSSGSGGFGYDPIFLLPDYGVTVAEISDAEKDAQSHRGKAARRLSCYLTAMAK